MTVDKDYVLGTHDDEISRLGLQHRVWRPRALDSWNRAGFTVGQTLLDIGCGPGYASLDMADIVGPSGRVVAVDRSKRFLDALDVMQRQRGIGTIERHELDLDESDLPAAGADGAWSRWVFAFVKRPRELLSRVKKSLKPGGRIVLHEYFDYSTWRFSPRCPEHEEFVRVVMQSWRESGGEPDIGLDLPRWLEELDFDIKSLNPIIHLVSRTHYMWQWPVAFNNVGIRRLVDLGHFTPERAKVISDAIAAREAAPGTLVITPAVLEIIAVRR